MPPTQQKKHAYTANKTKRPVFILKKMSKTQGLHKRYFSYKDNIYVVKTIISKENSLLPGSNKPNKSI